MRGQLAALGVRRVDVAGPERARPADRRSRGADRRRARADLRRRRRRSPRRSWPGCWRRAAPRPSPGATPARRRAGWWTAPRSGRAGADAAGRRPRPARIGRQSPRRSRDALGALVGELARRGVTVRVLDAGPDGEGAVAQLARRPAARDVARWAARASSRRPRCTGSRSASGLIAAVWFSALRGARRSWWRTRADRLVHRRPGRGPAGRRRPRGPGQPAVDWLGGASALLTEFGVYAALAVSPARPASGTRVRPGWTGSSAALATLRRHLGRPRASRRVAAGHRRPGHAGRAPDGRTLLRPRGRGRRRAAVPRRMRIGRAGRSRSRPANGTLVIAMAAILAGPRMTFLVAAGLGRGGVRLPAERPDGRLRADDRGGSTGVPGPRAG